MLGLGYQSEEKEKKASTVTRTIEFFLPTLFLTLQRLCSLVIFFRTNMLRGVTSAPRQTFYQRDAILQSSRRLNLLYLVQRYGLPVKNVQRIEKLLQISVFQSPQVKMCSHITHQPLSAFAGTHKEKRMVDSF